MKGIRNKDGGTTMVRVYSQDKQRLKDLKTEIQAIQRTEIGMAEVIKRTLNIPDLPTVLKRDAEIKRMRGQK